MTTEPVPSTIGPRLAKWLALCAVLTLGAWLYQHMTDSSPTFDHEMWLSGTRDDISVEAPRLRMADSLVEQGILVGLSRTQIDTMLGPQTSTQKFRPEYDYVYWLGPERSYISIDSEWLVLKLDSQGNVSEVRIVRD